MDFRLDEEQRELQDTLRRFCGARFPLERLAQREAGVDRSAWRELAGLGVFGLLADAELGLGMVEGAIVFEQLGAHLASGPVLWTTLAAPYVKGAADGALVVGGLEASNGPALVEHAGALDALLLLRPEGVFVCEAAELPAYEPLAPFDPLTPVGRCAALPRGARVGGAEDAARLRLAGAVLSAALQCGVSSAALETSRRYALEREQFDAPIGGFQALQHLLADMYVRDALARSATYAAAAVLDDPAIGDAREASAVAKLLAGEAALENARAAIQLHGGVGFTWEMAPNFLLKRAWVLEHAFGDGASHALALGAALEAAVA